jgi:chromosome segregation ATPase
MKHKYNKRAKKEARVEEMQNELEYLKNEKDMMRDNITNYENLLNDLDMEKDKMKDRAVLVSE